MLYVLSTVRAAKRLIYQTKAPEWDYTEWGREAWRQVNVGNPIKIQMP